MQSVVVTGVSTGIGWGISKVLVQKGFRVFGSVRKTEDAARLSQEFGVTLFPCYLMSLMKLRFRPQHSRYANNSTEKHSSVS